MIVPTVVPSVVFNSLVFLISDRTTGYGAECASDQCAGRLVVSLIADRGTDGGARKTSKNRATSAILTVLGVGIDSDERKKNGQDQKSLRHWNSREDR